MRWAKESFFDSTKLPDRASSSTCASVPKAGEPELTHVHSTSNRTSSGHGSLWSKGSAVDAR
eukprot:766639-Hanusia_phi.AAC.4